MLGVAMLTAGIAFWQQYQELATRAQLLTRRYSIDPALLSGALPLANDAFPDPHGAPSDSRFSPRPESCQQCIPRHIHHTYKTATLPPEYEAIRLECIAMHPGWNFTLWTDASARALIEERYGTAAALNWDSYRTSNIQRADALRYYVLHAFGGFYADLNIGCPRSWEPLRSFPAVFGRGLGFGLTNDFFAAAPAHPFIAQLIHALPLHNRNFFLPYATVMLSTGPAFVTLRWLWAPLDVQAGVRILPPEFFGGANHPLSFIQNRDAITGSWHSWDAEAVEWVGSAWQRLSGLWVLMLLLLVVAIAGLALGGRRLVPIGRRPHLPILPARQSRNVAAFGWSKRDV